MPVDSHIGQFYLCEECEHIFNYEKSKELTNEGLACPKCKTDFVRKFREGDLDRLLEVERKSAF